MAFACVAGAYALRRPVWVFYSVHSGEMKNKVACDWFYKAVWVLSGYACGWSNLGSLQFCKGRLKTFQTAFFCWFNDLYLARRSDSWIRHLFAEQGTHIALAAGQTSDSRIRPTLMALSNCFYFVSLFFLNWYQAVWKLFRRPFLLIQWFIYSEKQEKVTQNYILQRRRLGW